MRIAGRLAGSVPHPRYAAEETWYDNDAGPVVRLYAMTGGRTVPDRGGFDLITVVWAADPPAGPEGGDPTRGADLSPEQTEIMRLCQRPLSVSEIAAHLKLPLGSVRVLLSDLREAGLVAVPQQRGAADQPSRELLERVLSGLLAL